MNNFPEDLLSARETTMETPFGSTDGATEIFAVCLETDDLELLVPLKVYPINLRGKYARVIDEKGEPAVYPRDFFLPLLLPQDVVNTLIKVYAQAA